MSVDKEDRYALKEAIHDELNKLASLLRDCIPEAWPITDSIERLIDLKIKEYRNDR
jgi:hypothetical protein